MVEYTGTSLKLSDIVSCARVHKGKSLIAIQAFDNITIDVDYSAVGGDGAREPSLLFVTRKLITNGRRNFNLKGANGTPPSSSPGTGIPGRAGAAGKTAGSIIMAYLEVNVLKL